jgi:hypothetical protein
MRFQEIIYIQNENGAVRNKDILNVNMSSDMCVFESPLFNLSGASKIDCTGTTGTSYVISTATIIPLTFQFTANTESFTANSATFKYEIYKYATQTQSFITPPVYKSGIIEYSAISATSATTQYIPISGISLDGDYLVKGYYMYPVCTFFGEKLGKTIDTLTFSSGSEFGLYDSTLDYYFIALKQAEIPRLMVNASNTVAANQLVQQVVLPIDGQTNITVSNSAAGDIIVTLNGLVLAKNYDYTLSGGVITMNGSMVYGDIVTIIFTTLGGNNIVGDNINVNAPVVSGISNNQGSNNPYYDTTTGKYEIFTTVTPASGGAIIVMLNGATLASGIDYYQSISNPKRIILEGNIVLDDMITIVYFPTTNVVNGLNTNVPSVTWSILTGPQLNNGFFSLEVSTGTSFTTLYSSGYTSYSIGRTLYSDTFTASGTVGTILYYRVKNEKNYITLCGDIVTTIAYSEIIPLTIQTNSINSY